MHVLLVPVRMNDEKGTAPDNATPSEHSKPSVGRKSEEKRIASDSHTEHSKLPVGRKSEDMRMASGSHTEHSKLSVRRKSDEVRTASDSHPDTRTCPSRGLSKHGKPVTVLASARTKTPFSGKNRGTGRSGYTIPTKDN